jgi:hypothetical protein
MKALGIVIFILRLIEFVVFVLTNPIALLLFLTVVLAVALFVRWHVKNHVD